MFKFVHIADAHLDSAISSDKKNKAFILEALERAFKNAVNLCIDEKCDALLISGDLFDDDFLSFKTELMLRESFKRLDSRSIAVFYCLGNHDPKSSKLRKVKLGENVYTFDSENPKRYEIKNSDGSIKTVLAGVGYSGSRMEENLAKRFSKADKKQRVPYVGMLHTSLDEGGSKVYAPCTLDDLNQAGFDYWALGHVHKNKQYGSDRLVVYPGCICGRDFGETGAKGGYIAVMDENGIVSLEFKELADIAWHDIETAGFEDAKDAADMQEVCVKKISDISDSNKTNFIRLSLKGQCAIYELFNDEALRDLEDDLCSITGSNITLINKLTSALNPKDYANDKHLLSIALDMAEKMHSDEEITEQVIKTAETNYKGLDGGGSKEYVESLLDDIDTKLCEVMIKSNK